MKLSKKLKWIFFSLIIVFGICLVVLCSNPLRWSESRIESYILRITPIGSSFKDVEEAISKKKWDFWISKEHGFYHQRKKPAKVIGSMSIRADLGDYQDIPFEANVTVFWGFNEKEELTDIWVWKTWDGL